MKARSVQSKFLTTVISAILAIAVFVGSLCIYEMDRYIQQHTREFIDITCSNEASQVNDIFSDIESSVRIMESYVLSLFKRMPDVENHDNQERILQLAGEMFANVAANTNGAVAYYLRFDPAISDSTTGMFYTKMNGGEYVCLEPTDLSLYDKNDTEHVGWFWQPYEAGRPIWLDPYYNQNNGIMMISFVIPIYFEGQFIGVAGMDFDYTILAERIQQIKIYAHGFAHLELDGTVIQTGNELGSENTSQTAEMYLQASKDLANGMTLVLFASYDDITQIRLEMAYKILLSVIPLAVVFSVVVFFVVKKVVKPLKELTEASIKLSFGDYDVKIQHSDTYEIQQLSTAFENMLANLREHKRLQHLLAYRDSLTGLRNTTSYNEWVTEFDKKIREENVSFGVVVLDINCLKETNDTHGHIAGNSLIVTASQIICSTFKRSPVFRIGGDEFVVILQNRDLVEYSDLFERFEAECANASVEMDGATLPVSIAKGFSMFNSAEDTQFSDVFNRADNEMYKNKKFIKAANV